MLNKQERLRCSRVENALKERLLFITNCPLYILVHLILQYTYTLIHLYEYMQMRMAAGDLSFHHLLDDGLFVFFSSFLYTDLNVYVQYNIHINTRTHTFILGILVCRYTQCAVYYLTIDLFYFFYRFLKCICT